MSYWCPKPKGTTSDIYSKRSVLTQIMAVKYGLNWEMIQKRLETHTHEAAEKDKFGVTALHHVIRKHSKNRRKTCAAGRINRNSNDGNLDGDGDDDGVPMEIFRLLIEEYPDSLDLSDSMTGCNALHLACSNLGLGSGEQQDSSDDKMRKVVMMILEKRHETAMKLDVDGRLPLHRCKDIHIIRKLINLYPEGLGIVTKSHGYLPLHDACSDSTTSLEVVKLLIEQGVQHQVGIAIGGTSSSSKANNPTYCGGLLVKDLLGDIPIKTIFRRVSFLKKSSSLASSSRSARSDSHGRNGDINTNNDLDPNSVLWKKLSFIAKATYLTTRGFSCSNKYHHNQSYHLNSTSSNNQDAPLLVHSIIECGAPISLVKLALKFHPDQILMRDEVDGRTSLSIACAKVNTNPEIISLLLGEEEAEGSSDGDDESSKVNDGKVNKNKGEIQNGHGHHEHKQNDDNTTIMETTIAKPTIQKKGAISSMCDRNGRLPLHVALESGRTYRNGVEKIANAAPLAMQTRDIQTGMYPFMLASIPNYRWDNTCIDTIYTMIRSVPHVMHKYCPEDDNDATSSDKGKDDIPQNS